MSRYTQLVEEDKTLNENHRLSVALIYLSTQINQRREVFFKNYGVTPSQFRLLFILHLQFNGTSSSQVLKEHMIDANPDMSRMIKRLVDDGFIEQSPLSDNKRTKQILITQKGIDTVAAAHLDFPKLLDPLNELSSDEKQFLLSLLKRLAHAIEDSSSYKVSD